MPSLTLAQNAPKRKKKTGFNSPAHFPYNFSLKPSFGARLIKLFKSEDNDELAQKLNLVSLSQQFSSVLDIFLLCMCNLLSALYDCYLIMLDTLRDLGKCLCLLSFPLESNKKK